MGVAERERSLSMSMAPYVWRGDRWRMGSECGPPCCWGVWGGGEEGVRVEDLAGRLEEGERVLEGKV